MVNSSNVKCQILKKWIKISNINISDKSTWSMSIIVFNNVYPETSLIGIAFLRSSSSWKLMFTPWPRGIVMCVSVCLSVLLSIILDHGQRYIQPHFTYQIIDTDILIERHIYKTKLQFCHFGVENSFLSKLKKNFVVNFFFKEACKLELLFLGIC